MKSRKVLLALDDSEHSRAAVEAVYNQHCCLPTDEVHLVTVVQPMSDLLDFRVKPAIPPDEEAKAKKLLLEVSALLMQSHQVCSTMVHMHVLAAVGGAASTILTFAKSEGVAFIVVGSRGMGATKSVLVSLVGLGSVGDALAKQSRCPVLIFRHDSRKHEGQRATTDTLGKKVCVSFDGSQSAHNALHWAIENVMQPADVLHIVCVALILPPGPILDEPMGAATSVMYGTEAEEFETKSLANARLTAESAAAEAVTQGVAKVSIYPVGLKTSSDVGHALAEYVNSKGMDIMVCGSRGTSALKRILENCVGLGSVSTHLAHSMHGLLAVVREPVERPLATQGK